MNYESHKAAYDRDGFVIVRQLLSKPEFDDLCNNLDRYIRDVVPRLHDQHAFYDDKTRPETLKQMQHMGVDPFFKAYTRHPKWTALAEALVGEPVTVQEPEWFNKPAGTNHFTPPHQDNYYFNLKPPNVCTVWMALDPVDEETGCLRYVAGSYRDGVRPHGASHVLGFSQGVTDYSPRDEACEVPIYLRPGDVAVHHGNTIHRANANRSKDRNRRAFAMVCRGVSCRRDEEAYKRYEESFKQQHQAMGLKT
jgi:phytanoyl-CoA hydroxylase